MYIYITGSVIFFQILGEVMDFEDRLAFAHSNVLHVCF